MQDILRDYAITQLQLIRKNLALKNKYLPRDL